MKIELERKKQKQMASKQGGRYEGENSDMFKSIGTDATEETFK
jgi:hypothetical protein